MTQASLESGFQQYGTNHFQLSEIRTSPYFKSLLYSIFKNWNVNVCVLNWKEYTKQITEKWPNINFFNKMRKYEEKVNLKIFSIFNKQKQNYYFLTFELSFTTKWINFTFSCSKPGRKVVGGFWLVEGPSSSALFTGRFLARTFFGNFRISFNFRFKKT